MNTNPSPKTEEKKTLIIDDCDAAYGYLNSLNGNFAVIQNIFRASLDVVVECGEDNNRLITAHFKQEDLDAAEILIEKTQKVRHALGKIDEFVRKGKQKQIEQKLHRWITNSWPTPPRARHDLPEDGHPINFKVPKFSAAGIISIKNEFGSKSEWKITEHQRDFVNSVLDPNIRCAFLEAPTGAGKTLWSAWACLALLESRTVGRIYYDRPLETVGSKKLGFMPGDLDEKAGIYHGPLRDKFAEILGQGNIKIGHETLGKMEDAKMVERYDELYKRGDTVYEGVMLIDEAQNKTPDEIFHLTTRANDTSKVIIVGDSEFQIDFNDKAQSGFAEAFQMHEHFSTPGIALHRFDESDIKRGEFTKNIYKAYKAWRELTDKPKQGSNTPPAENIFDESPTVQ